MVRSILTIVFGLATSLALAGENLIETQAFSGKPFGVGVIRVGRLPGFHEQIPYDVRFDITDADGRVLYPVFFRENLAGADSPDDLCACGAMFLVKGDGPVEFSFSDGTATYKETVTPKPDADGKKALLTRWWRDYRLNAADSNRVPVVENYTTAMLSRRLELPFEKKSSSSWSDDRILGSLLGFEEMRLAMQADRLLSTGEAEEKIDLPLPKAVLPPPITVPAEFKAEIEPLAKHVPAECFYLRFGSYSNFRWFRDTVDRWGGNLREITVSRSLDYDIAGRLVRQLILKDSELGRLLGDSAIADMAVIGMDTFVREGAAIGVLFQERQPGLLTAAIKTQRAAALMADQALKEETVELAGKKVSFIHAADNSVRSYYAVDGEFHLVTTSSTIARRFLESKSGSTLADLQEFAYARSKHPSVNSNAILAYLSDPFIRNLVSPEYRVEMTRRMAADADIELVALAMLAAKGEQAPHATLAELSQGGFLPPKFGVRADGSRTILKDDLVTDSLRGARRSFLPVADVTIPGVTKSEADAYEQFSTMYRGLYQRMDPISISIARQPLVAGRERIVADLSITPFTRQNLGSLANWMPPPTKEGINPGTDLLLFAEVATPKSRLFAGLAERSIPVQFHRGQVVVDHSLLERPPAFLGERGRGIARDFLKDSNDKDRDGYFDSGKRGDFDLSAGRQWGEWWMVGMEPDLVRKVSPNLKIEDRARESQVHVHIGDIGASSVAPLVRAYQYVRERQASQSNANMLDSFTQQLRSPESQALADASLVLAAKPVCPLGGTYRRDPMNYDFSTNQPWFSTAALATGRYVYGHHRKIAPSSQNAVPQDYKSHLLEWFHGLDIELGFQGQTMLTHFELDVSINP